MRGLPAFFHVVFLLKSPLCIFFIPV
jgi:hypothetical protein